MDGFKFLQEYCPFIKQPFDNNIYIQVYPNGQRVIFFEFDGIPYKSMTIPETAPTRAVLDIINVFQYEFYDETTVDNIESHLEIFFRNF
jgi:hypothetical protein